MRKLITYTLLTGLLTGIVILFWYTDLVYRLPTPVPENYVAVRLGETIKLPGSLLKGGKPVLLHFFNPTCPCSRFNIPHFKSLNKEFGNEVNFAVVVMSKRKYDEEEIRKIIGYNIPVITDSALAAVCGVYSTPQAVILDKNQKLFYRGNYSKNRYCTDENSHYAKFALESLLMKRRNYVFDDYALKAYGCKLPTCEK